MVPKGWLRQRIGSAVKVQGGYAFPSEQFSDVGLPIVRISNIQNARVDLEDAPRFAEDTKLARFLLRDKDILIAMSGATTGKIGRFKMAPEVTSAYLNQRVGRFTITNTAKMSYEFLWQYLAVEQVQNVVAVGAIGGAQPNISGGDIENIVALLPPLPEQQKIAEILSAWDKAIETTEALLANARTQKRALMQSLLTGTRRFPGFEDHPWREVRLGDVVSGIPGGGTPDKSNAEYWGGDLPWVSVKDLKATVLVHTQDMITEAALNSSATNAFPAGTIVMATRMAVGSCAVLGRRMAINQDLKAILPNERILNRYLFNCLQSSQEALAALGTGSTVKGITLETLREMKIGLPEDKDEQAQISESIDCAGSEVTTLEADLDHLRTEKKSLMQQLLTGKRRVVV